MGIDVIDPRQRNEMMLAIARIVPGELDPLAVDIIDDPDGLAIRRHDLIFGVI